MSQKGDTLSVIAKIVEQWLMVNCDLDVEKVLDLKEFIESLDAPPSFKLKDGTLIHINGNNGHDVEIKHPTFDIHKPLSKEDNAFIEESNNKIMEIRKQIMQLSDVQFEQLKESLKKDCEHVFIKMDNGAAMGPYDQAIGDLCKLCGKWENVKTLQQVMKEANNV